LQFQEFQDCCDPCCPLSVGLFLDVDEDEAEVDGLGSEQSVALRGLGQWERVVRGLGRLRTKLVLVDGRRQRRVTERPRQSEVRHRQSTSWLVLEYQLIADAAVHHLHRVVLVVVDAGLQRPLERVRREPRRLVVELRNKVIRAVRTKLDVWEQYIQ